MHTIGTTSTNTVLAISADDLRRHLYVVGKSGTGKTTLLHHLMQEQFDRGFAFIDPHGDEAEAIADCAPAGRIQDILYFDPSDLAHPVGFNVLDATDPDLRSLVAARIVSAFKAIWGDSWGPRLEYILTNALRLLLDTPSTLLGLPKLLTDAAYRDGLVRACRDPIVRGFWEREFGAWDKRFRAEAIAPIQNKIGAILAVPALRNIVGQQHSTLNIPKLMDEGKILIVNLAKGRLGEAPAHLLGALLVSAFAQAAEGRSTIPEAERRDFTLFVDEFQNFATDSFGTILSEARKWRLSLVLAHQFLGQLPDDLRRAVFGNAGTIVCFRSGAEDAPLLAAELGLKNPEILTDAPNHTAWVKLITQGTPTNAMRMTTFPPVPGEGRLPAIRRRSRACHTRSRASVEAEIAEFLAGP